jgi:hypothetical protein
VSKKIPTTSQPPSTSIFLSFIIFCAIPNDGTSCLLAVHLYLPLDDPATPLPSISGYSRTKPPHSALTKPYLTIPLGQGLPVTHLNSPALLYVGPHPYRLHFRDSLHSPCSFYRIMPILLWTLGTIASTLSHQKGSQIRYGPAFPSEDLA